jgi:hypothetical protein
MYDIYLNCREKKRKRESAYRTAMREIHTHTHTHLTKKSSAVVHEKKG